MEKFYQTLILQMGKIHKAHIPLEISEFGII